MIVKVIDPKAVLPVMKLSEASSYATTAPWMFTQIQYGGSCCDEPTIRPATIEELIVRHERKELLETPVMLDLIERKVSQVALRPTMRRAA